MKDTLLLKFLAMFLIVGMSINFLPSVSEAHSKKETYYVKTETTSISWGWDSRKNPETGEIEKVWVKLSESTTTTYSSYEAEVQHSHFSWKDAVAIVGGVAGLVTAVATLGKGD